MKTILLIEDDAFLVDIYTTKLKKEGFDVKSCADGGEALEQIKDLEPDLVLLDIVLPQTDGWEILKELKKHSKEKKFRVIVLSNLGQKAEVEKGLKLGAVKYLIKAHYTPSRVVEEVKKILNPKS